MSDADPSATIPPAKDDRSELQGLDPGELLARGLHTVKPSGGAGGWEPPTAEEVSRLLPQYRIEKLVGRSGMGAVYKGIQISLERPVAIKLPPAELTADKEFVARFEREARMLAKLQHSRIITIHDFGQTSDGHLYFVMEYIDGTRSRCTCPSVAAQKTRFLSRLIAIGWDGMASITRRAHRSRRMLPSLPVRAPASMSLPSPSGPMAPPLASSRRRPASIAVGSSVFMMTGEKKSPAHPTCPSFIPWCLESALGN